MLSVLWRGQKKKKQFFAIMLRDSAFLCDSLAFSDIGTDLSSANLTDLCDSLKILLFLK